MMMLDEESQRRNGPSCCLICRINKVPLRQGEASSFESMDRDARGCHLRALGMMGWRGIRSLEMESFVVQPQRPWTLKEIISFPVNPWLTPLHQRLMIFGLGKRFGDE